METFDGLLTHLRSLEKTDAETWAARNLRVIAELAQGDRILVLGALEERGVNGVIMEQVRAALRPQRTPAQTYGAPPPEPPEEANENELLSNWVFYNPTDALSDTSKIEFLVEGMLTKQSLSIVFGAEGSLKSMLLNDLALCVATGRRWLEPFPGRMASSPPMATVQTPVLWLDFDNGRRRMNKRMAAFLRAYNAPEDTPIHYVSVPRVSLDMSTPRHPQELAQVIERYQAGLVIVDNLLLTAGGVDENSAAMAHVMNGFRWLAESTGAAMQLIHHQRKASTSGADGLIRKGERLRGHSSIAAACDLILHVDRKEGENNILLTPTKVRDYLTFTSAAAMFTFEHFEDSEEMRMARMVGWVADDKMQSELAAIMTMILAVVTDKPGISQRLLTEEVRDRFAAAGDPAPGVNRVRGLIKQMADEGKLDAVAGEEAENRKKVSYYRGER